MTRLDRLGWTAVGAALVAGVALRAAGAGLGALWAFVAVSVLLAWLLPFERALVSPLFAGVLGWLVDMFPFVILTGWVAVAGRFGLMLLTQRRLPRGGRWIWLPAFLVVWTGLGVLVVSRLDFKHFLLLLGIQGVASAVLLAAVDTLTDARRRAMTAEALSLFVVVLSAGVLLQWVGVPLEPLQDLETSERAEEAYGVNAFPNSTGMIKYARTQESGAGELRREIKRLGERNPGLPEFEVFRPKFRAFEATNLLVRFEGSARPVENLLGAHEVQLVWDNVGIAPANTVPRLRSFPRNALTYAGVCVAVAPLALFLSWSDEKRRRLLGRLGLAACIFGAGFSLARGAWVALAGGALYLLIDRLLPARRAVQLLVATLIGAVVLTGFFVVRYGVDPLNARAGGGASVATRTSLYQDTVETVRSPLHLLFGFGTEQPRTEEGAAINTGTYVPRAGTHSTYLNYLFRTGVPGTLAIAALYVVAGLHARTAAKARGGTERRLGALSAAAVAIAAAHAVILNYYVEPAYTLTITLVLGIAMAGATELSRSVLPWKKA